MRRAARVRAMTLLEVVIAVSLIAMLLGVLFTFFTKTAEIRRQAADRVQRAQVARQVIERMAAELRACVGFDEVGFPVEQRLIGDRRSITFLTTAMPARHQYGFLRPTDQPPPAQHDLTLVGYRLWVDPENTDENGEPIVGGIIRTEKKTLNQYLVEEDDPYDVRNDLWSHELGTLEFRYFDGREWDTKWDITAGNSLPQLVQITVGFRNVTRREWENADLLEFPLSEYPYGSDEVRPDRYTIVVRIPAADIGYGSRFQRAAKQLSEQLGIGGEGAGS